MEIIQLEKNITMFKNIISEKEAKFFVHTGNNASLSDWQVYNKLDRDYRDEWDDQILSIPNIPWAVTKCLYVCDIVSEKIKTEVTKYLGGKEFVFNKMDHLYRFRVGDEMKVHYDMGMDPIIKYGAVLYLNDDYEGGEIYYPNLGIEIKPEAMSLVLHSSNMTHSHGVKPVTKGTRYSLTTFLRLPQKSN